MLPVLVVAAAIVGGSPSRLLVAQRGHPPGLAGRWELPGGKVERSEEPVAALVRECREELGVAVLVGAALGPDLVTPAGARLRAYRCRLAAGTPRPTEHRALYWAAPAELDALDWIASNRPLLPLLHGAVVVG